MGSKLSVQLFGPMQLQASQNTIQSEGCQLKVTIEFSDDDQRVLLNQMPLLNDQLIQVMENMPTEAVAQMQKEQKLKLVQNHLSVIMSQILASSLITDAYNGSQILCNFQIIELDQDIVQAMIQTLSKALLNSPFKLRCLPIGVTILLNSQIGYIVDPNLEQLRDTGLTTHKIRLAFNVDTEELLMSSMQQLQSKQGLNLDQMEEIVSLGLSVAKKIHGLIR